MLNGLFGAIGMKSRALDLRLRRAWPQAVGPLFAENVRPSFSDGGTLHVAARNDAWAQEARNLDQSIVERLGALGFSGIERIRVRAKRWENFPKRPKPPLPVAEPPPGSLPAEVERRAEKIGDATLRAAVRSFAAIRLGTGREGA